MTNQDRKNQSQKEKYAAKVDRAALQHVGRAGAENLIGHTTTESGA